MSAAFGARRQPGARGVVMVNAMESLAFHSGIRGRAVGARPTEVGIGG